MNDDEIIGFLGTCDYTWPLVVHHCMEEDEHEGDHRCACGERHEKDARRG